MTKIEKPSYILNNVSLKNYNTWKTGGDAQFFAMPETLGQYKECIAWAVQENLQITFIGQGSNALISDKGIRGLVLCSKKLQNMDVISEDKDFVLRCDAGALKYKVMRSFLKYNLSPSLFLSGIPGDIGGGVVMNAGVGDAIEPREFCEIVKSFKVLKWQIADTSDTQNLLDKGVDLKEIYQWNNKCLYFETKEFQNKDIEWSYRSSKNWQPGFIYEVILSYPMNPIEGMAEKVTTAIKNRRLKQPLDKPSCGSVFVNPPNHRSGQLIESCDLKGFQIGGAQVSYKHANFIVNTGRATSQDIHSVIEHVKSKVFEKYQIHLHTEVVYLGPWQET